MQQRASISEWVKQKKILVNQRTENFETIQRTKKKGMKHSGKILYNLWATIKRMFPEGEGREKEVANLFLKNNG